MRSFVTPGLSSDVMFSGQCCVCLPRVFGTKSPLFCLARIWWFIFKFQQTNTSLVCWNFANQRCSPTVLTNDVFLFWMLFLLLTSVEDCFDQSGDVPCASEVIRRTIVMLDACLCTTIIILGTLAATPTFLHLLFSFPLALAEGFGWLCRSSGVEHV